MDFRKTMLYFILLLGLAVVLSTLVNRHASDFAKDIDKEFLDNPGMRKLNLSKQEKIMLSILLKYMDRLDPENMLRWSSIHPRHKTFNFKETDQYMELCQSLQVPVVLVPLIEPQRIPDWVFQDRKGNPIDREMLLQRLQEHIFTVMSRYKNRIRGWNVVSRAVAQDGQLYQNKWLQIIGPDYVQKAYEFAHQADSTAELYYSDAFTENPLKRQGVINLVHSLQANGVHLQAIGIEGRWGLEDPSIKEIEKSIVDLSALCGKAMILDLDINNRQPSEQDEGTAASRSYLLQKMLDGYDGDLYMTSQNQFSQRYAELFQLFHKHKDKISQVTFWGIPIFQHWQDLAMPVNQPTVTVAK
jgi:endo-1,4-beta-xylanase